MKMKEVQAYLSIVGFVQILLLAFGGAAVNEFLKPQQDKDRLLLLLTLTLVAFSIAVLIYYKIFNISQRKKK